MPTSIPLGSFNSIKVGLNSIKVGRPSRAAHLKSNSSLARLWRVSVFPSLWLGFSLLSFLSIPFNSFAQSLQWDSTARPEIYPSQVALFRSFDHGRKDIVFLGNSITFWGGWNELLHNKHIRNRGIPGDNTFGVLDRLDEVINGQPAKVFILIGINDIAKGIPDSVILNNYQRIITRIKTGSPRTKIYWQTILPVNETFKKLTAHYRHERIKAINEKAKALAAKEHITLIDLYTAFTGPDGRLPAHLSFDGVHLQKAGYDIWVDILKKGGYLK